MDRNNGLIYINTKNYYIYVYLIQIQASMIKSSRVDRVSDVEIC